MKNITFYPIATIVLLMSLIGSITTHAQDIHFTSANGQNTNDGINDYFEADIMIQTINDTGSFKLSSGQLYFTYNIAAFGENVKANARFETSQPNAGGYICGQYIDAAAADIYGVFTVNDNTAFRVSWAFSQVFSSSTFANPNITPTPTKLFHIKFQYIDINQNPMVAFEEGEVYDDQFYTACGPAGGPFTSADCGASPGTRLFNDTFGSIGITLSNDNIENPVAFAIYPNPATDVINIKSNLQLTKVELYNMLGKRVLNTTEIKRIQVNHFNAGVYFLKAHTATGSLTRKIMIE